MSRRELQAKLDAEIRAFREADPSTCLLLIIASRLEVLRTWRGTPEELDRFMPMLGDVQFSLNGAGPSVREQMRRAWMRGLN